MPEDILRGDELRRQLAAAVTAIGRLLADDSAGTAPGSRSFRQCLCETETVLRQACQSLDTTLREKAGQLHHLQSTLNEEMALRARADRQVCESEERLRLALRSAGQGLYDLNVQTGDAVVTPEYAEMLGYDPETFVETNASWIERLHPDDREAVAATYRDYISGKVPEYRVEFRQKTKNGDWIWILSIGRIVEYDGQGAPLRMLGTHTDITERRIAEEKMRESELFKNAVLDGLSTHIAVLDHEGTILAVNAAWSRFAAQNGLIAEHVGPGVNYLHVCESARGPFGDEAIPFASGIRDVIAGTRATFEMEYPCDSPGERRWFMGRVTRIAGEKGVRVIVAHEAITERKLAELALADAARQWQMTFDAVGSGVSLLDADMRIVRSNRAMASLLGKNAEDLKGKHCWTVVHGSERPHADCPTARMLDSRKTEDGEVRIGDHWFHITADPLFDEDGRLSGAVHVMRDISDRKKMVDRLKHSEALLADAQQLAHIGSFQVDADTGSISWSMELYRLFEIPENDPPLTFEQICSLANPADVGHLRSVVESFSVSAGPVSVDFRVVLRSGHGKHLRLIGQELLDEQGRMAGVGGVVMDITREKKNAEVRRQDEERMSRLLHMSTMQNTSEQELFSYALESVVMLSGSTGGYFHLYDEDTRILTLTAWSETVRKQCSAAGGQHYPIAHAGIWADSIRNRDVVVHNDYESETRKKGLPAGHFALFRHLGVPVFDGDRIVAAVGVANKEEPYSDADIRQIQFFMGDMWKIIARTRAEMRLAESEQAFRNLFESSLDGVFRIAADSRIERANAAFAQIFGFSSPQEIIGRSIADFWKHPLERSMYLDTLRQHGAVQRYPFLAVDVFGKTIHVEVTANLIRNSSGEYVATEGILRDVTGQKQLAEQLLHAQKMEAVGRLAGGIAHDFNNILSAIVGFASLPLMSEKVSDAERATLQQILVLAERAGTLTRGLMAFSRRQVMAVRAVDLNQIMGISAKLLQRMIGEDINLVLRESPDPLPVQADTGQMEQVLMNLATNARDAMPAGGKLTIEARRIRLREHEVEGLAAGDYALITVADTGTGIAPDLLDHVFEPFFTTKEEGKGTGLGLASVYGIMQQHGGSVRVESEPGAGTTFSLYIPISMSAAGHFEDAGSRPISGGSETILLVEDDATLRRITGKILAAHGYAVLEAVNGAEMLSACAAREGRIDLILSDVVMPVMDGLEAWRTVRLRYPDIRGVFMSGYISDEGKRAAIEQFGLPLIVKPFEPRHLLEMVRRELDRA